jgi:hypothetical protein
VVEARAGGRPAEAIVAYSASHAMDLIVMGSHGRSGLTRALLGSVSDEVLRLAPCPVVVVPPGATMGRVESTRPSVSVTPALGHCSVCSRPSRESICDQCRARIRGEALRLKHEREKA